MAPNRTAGRYKKLYTWLVRRYPEEFQERFGEEMIRTFNDLCRDCLQSGEGLTRMAFRVYCETSRAIFKEHLSVMIKRELTIRLIYWAVVVGFLLMIPLVAMQFTDEVQWDLFDFVVMGGALYGIGLAYLLIARRALNVRYRVAFGLGIVTAFLLFWVNGAVGIIGNEGQPANLLYGAVFAVGLLGSIIARFKPRGMSFTLFTAAAVQLVVPVVALIAWPDVSWGHLGMFRVFVLNAFFATLFVASALLFRQADSAATGSATPAA